MLEVECDTLCHTTTIDETMVVMTKLTSYEDIWAAYSYTNESSSFTADFKETRTVTAKSLASEADMVDLGILVL